MSDLRDSSILIAGAVRNCGRVLNKNVKIIQRAFGSARSVSFFLVESDSDDDTSCWLEKLSSDQKNFDYVSLGSIRDVYPLRTDRLAVCRNVYLDALSSEKYCHISHLVVIDLDEENLILSESGVASCWMRSDWDVCCANQLGPYYDIWALRHGSWVPSDCWAEVEFLKAYGVSKFKAISSAVYARMITIPRDSQWIRVLSAFGGMAVYRKEILKGIRYRGLDQKGDEVCEHVSLCNQITSKGGRVFINPNLINVNVVEHSRHAGLFGLLKFWFLCNTEGTKIFGLFSNLLTLRSALSKLIFPKKLL